MKSRSQLLTRHDSEESRHTRRGGRPARPAVEALEVRALLAATPSFTLADSLDALDNINLERLTQDQTIQQAVADNAGLWQTVIADGQAQTEGLVQQLQADRGQGDPQQVRSDIVQINQVRALMRQAQRDGSLIERTLLRDEKAIDRDFNRAAGALKRHHDPSITQQVAIAAIDQVAGVAQNQANNGASALNAIDTAINGYGGVVQPPVQTQTQVSGTFSGTHTQGTTTTPEQGALQFVASPTQSVQTLLITAIEAQLAQQYNTTSTVTLSGLTTQGNTMSGSYAGQGTPTSGPATPTTDKGSFQVLVIPTTTTPVVTQRPVVPPPPVVIQPPQQPPNNFFTHEVFNGTFMGRVTDHGTLDSQGNQVGCPGNATLNGNIQVVVDHASESVFNTNAVVSVDVTNVVQSPSASLRNAGTIANGICDDYSGEYVGQMNVSSLSGPVTLTLQGTNTDMQMTLQINGSAGGNGTWQFSAQNGVDTASGNVSFS